MRFVAAIASTLFMASTAFAQSVVGTSIVDGKKIEILSNQTWRFADAVDSPCTPVALEVYFCGAPPIWTPTRPPTADIAAMFQYDARSYGQFVVEAVGTADGITAEFLRNAAVTNAATISGTAKEEIPVLSLTPATVDGVEGETVMYAMNLNGVRVIISNTIILNETRASQIILFMLGSEPTPEFLALNGEFLALVKLKKPQ